MSSDCIARFSFAQAPIRGQWVRLEQVLDALGEHQAYPDNVRNLLAEMLAAVALVADGIKFRGAVSLQSRGSGPLTTVLAECRERHLLRGIARWAEGAELGAGTSTDTSIRTLLGNGQLALSLIPEPADDGRGAPPQPYQGRVALDEADLAGNLESYFRDSEQLPTRLVFAVAGSSVTGLLLQRMPIEDGASELALDARDALWEEVGLLLATLRSDELASLPLETLLRRLFAEHVLTLNPPRPLRFECTCNREKTSATLEALPKAELLEILEEDGEITVTCEVCGAIYRYDPVDVHVITSGEAPRLH